MDQDLKLEPKARKPKGPKRPWQGVAKAPVLTGKPELTSILLF
jgi:hypothetical protein